MNELDEVWAAMIAEAHNRAQTNGRSDVADYLALKASNDQIRATAVRWLLDSMLEIAAEANRRSFAVSIENEQPHRFEFNRSNPVGYLLRLRQGVRCLTLEAGWTRTPADGFMRGNALAAARIRHFGMANQNVDLILLRTPNLPEWFSIDKQDKRVLFGADHLLRHFQIFLGVL